MNKISFLFIALTLGIISLKAQKIYEYPVTPKDSVYNTYFDTTIYDPYQWMENPNDIRLAEWLDSQNRIKEKQSRKQLKKQTLRAQIATMYNAVEKEKLKDYVKETRENLSKYVFDTKLISWNRPPDLLYKKRGDSFYKTLIRIKKFQENKQDYVWIENKMVNEDLDIVAIEFSHKGSDWRELYFFDLKTGDQLEDTLKNLRARTRVIWDGNGVYYDAYNKPKAGYEHLETATGQTLYYHKIGTKQKEDVVMHHNPDDTGKNNFYFYKKDSSEVFFHHFLYSGSKSFKAIGTAMLNQGKSFEVKDFIIYPNSQEINLRIEEVFGDTVLIKSDWNAPNGKVLMANVRIKNKLSELVPEFDIPLFEVNRLGKDKIACVYRNKGKYSILIYNVQGELLKKMDFPEGKKVNSFYENDTSAKYTDFYLSSFYHPNLWYQLSLSDFSIKPSQAVSVPYKPEELETRFVYYPSKDGTQIPMYITCLKKTKLDGKNPTLLYGYGGYGHTIEPRFNQSTTLFLLHGGVLAVPNIRGGGAEGSEWSLNGRRLKKQNAIDDFIAAAEFLINEKYTSSNKLAIKGGSHGGLLVGAALTQRPELFKAAIAEAGALDMLRLENFTVGGVSLNNNEFGTTNNREEFKNLLSYSPLHHIKKDVKYPDVLIITGDSDDRVPPLHSYKFLASLQEKGSPESLYELYIVPDSGHGGALTDIDWVDELLFESYFLFDELEVKFW
jgi:prolyl oligopeptidase